jgi:hypothetical protein
MNDGDSTTTFSEPHEVWLRGNMRVAGVLGIVAMLLDGGALGAVLMAMQGGGESLAWWGVAAVTAAAASGLMLLAWASLRPRLVRQGDSLLVQVSPLVRQEVPLEVIECFFPGSNPLDADGLPTRGEQAAFRVGTLVIRLAERAIEYRSGGTFTPWATWSDSSIVLDGRWCEPLSPELVKSLSSRLVTAKRAATAGAGG